MQRLAGPLQTLVWFCPAVPGRPPEPKEAALLRFSVMPSLSYFHVSEGLTEHWRPVPWDGHSPDLWVWWHFPPNQAREAPLLPVCLCGALSPAVTSSGARPLGGKITLLFASRRCFVGGHAMKPYDTPPFRFALWVSVCTVFILAVAYSFGTHHSEPLILVPPFLKPF